MKKIYLFAAIAAALVSCSSSEDETVNNLPESDAISFDSYVNDQTRALEKSVFAEGDQLLINAFQSEETTVDKEFVANFMQNELLTRSATGWDYSNIKFWPKNSTDRISFVAVHPVVDPYIGDGKLAYNFSVNDNPASQEEFLWSTITDAYRDDRNGTHQNGVQEDPATTPINNVVFNFRHGLSKIVFNAKTAVYYPGTTITITDIVVNNLYGSGVYNIPYSLTKGTWEVTGDQNKNYTILTGGTTAVVDTYTRILGSSLLLIPQTLSTDDKAPSTVTIKYTVKYTNPSAIVNEERTFNLATVGLKDGNTWEQDKVYNYNFNIALDMITFDATISSWSDSANSSMSVK